MNDIRSRSGAIFAAMAPAMRAIFSRTPGLQGMYGKTAPFFRWSSLEIFCPGSTGIAVGSSKTAAVALCLFLKAIVAQRPRRAIRAQPRDAPAFGGRMIRRGPEPALTIALSPRVDCARLRAKPQLPRRDYNRARAKALQASALAPISADERYNRSPPECRQRL